MAKQSGIHQLRGKVGEHSYYRQTGIESGIVRSINQAMSGKVKTDEAFANTRLNNAEFGQAGRIASILGQYISPKFRPMVLPFSQSKMAKILLNYLKTDSVSPWGQRNLTPSNSGDAQVAALNAVAKNNFKEFGITIVVDEEKTEVTFTTSPTTIEKLSAIGADGVIVKFIASTSWIGKYMTSEKKYAPSYARANVYSYDFNEPSPDDERKYTYALRPVPPEGWPAFAAERMGVAILLPYRDIADTRHTLQEHCTYIAFLLQDGAVI